MIRKNRIGMTLTGTGIFVMFLGFIAGLVFANMDGEFHFSVAFQFWLWAFISGMLLVGFAEIIYLLDTINSKLKDQTGVMNKIVKPKENTPINKEMKLTEKDKDYIGELLKENNVPFTEVHGTPFEDQVIVENNGQYQLFDIGGFKPYRISKDKWSGEMLEWYNKDFEK